MEPFPTRSDINELYIQENIFSRPFDNPYRNSLFFSFLEPLYREYGVDGRFIARTCLRYAKNAETILDIGCSTGSQLQHFLFLKPDIEVLGIEIDPQAKEKADDHMKDRIIIDDFIEHEFSRTFDIITMKFVIEHLLDFRPYINKTLRLLRSDGVFFLSTHDINSRKARQLKAEWQLINNPYYKIGHLRWFNKKALNHFVELFGLKILTIKNRGELIYYLPARLQNIMIILLGKDESTRRFISWYAPRIIYALLFDCLLSQTLGYGDSLYAFLTKKS